MRTIPGTAGRGGFTLMELLVVIGVIAILAAILLPAINTALAQGDRTQAKGDVGAIYTALQAYLNEYGKFPVSGSGDTTLGKSESIKVIKALLGDDNTLNPRKINFLPGQNALTTGEFVDPWGNQYQMAFDLNLDNKISFDGEDRRVTHIAFSLGPDEQGGNDDDIVSYRH